VSSSLGVAQGAPVGAQAAAQGLEFVGQVVGSLGLAHGQLERARRGRLLGHVAGGFDGHSAFGTGQQCIGSWLRTLRFGRCSASAKAGL
jgi:hypothetical protein